MPEHTIKPLYTDDNIQEEPKNVLSSPIYEKLKIFLNNFDVSPTEKHDILRHVILADIPTALKDSIPMFVFFKLHANIAKEKEELMMDEIKKIENTAVTDPDKTIKVQKSLVYNNEKYIKCQSALRRYRTIRRNCEDLAEAMKMRKEIAQTKSANSRAEIGGYSTTQY